MGTHPSATSAAPHEVLSQYCEANDGGGDGDGGGADGGGGGGDGDGGGAGGGVGCGVMGGGGGDGEAEGGGGGDGDADGGGDGEAGGDGPQTYTFHPWATSFCSWIAGITAAQSFEAGAGHAHVPSSRFSRTRYPDAALQLAWPPATSAMI